MNSKLLLASFTLLALPLAAQEPAHNKVTNGTFTGTLVPWVMGGGYSVNPGLESGIDVTGLGVSDSFGVNAGGQVTPPPYPPNTLEQNVTLDHGGEYEFRMDAIGYRNSTTNNADIGTIWVEFNSVEIARFAFGSYTSPEQKRAQLCSRFTVASGGTYVLKIYFQRAFLGGAANPRMNIDNVRIDHDTTPTFCMLGNRRLGGNVTLRVDGYASAPYAVFLAPTRLAGGVAIPGFGGLLHLDPTTVVLFVSGQLDGSGTASTPFGIPNIAALLTNPLHYQAVTVLAPSNDLSLPVTLVMTQ
jgi:hypothetical protein